jgi:hypothetical protein
MRLLLPGVWRCGVAQCAAWLCTRSAGGCVAGLFALAKHAAWR